MTVLKNTLLKDPVSDKILLMRMKMKDSSYVDNAVQRIALVLSRRIVEKPRAY